MRATPEALLVASSAPPPGRVTKIRLDGLTTRVGDQDERRLSDLLEPAACARLDQDAARTTSHGERALALEPLPGAVRCGEGEPVRRLALRDQQRVKATDVELEVQLPGGVRAPLKASDRRGCAVANGVAEELDRGVGHGLTKGVPEAQ